MSYVPHPKNEEKKKIKKINGNAQHDSCTNESPWKYMWFSVINIDYLTLKKL